MLDNIVNIAATSYNCEGVHNCDKNCPACLFDMDGKYCVGAINKM